MGYQLTDTNVNSLKKYLESIFFLTESVKNLTIEREINNLRIYLHINQDYLVADRLLDNTPMKNVGLISDSIVDAGDTLPLDFPPGRINMIFTFIDIKTKEKIVMYN